MQGLDSCIFGNVDPIKEDDPKSKKVDLRGRPLQEPPRPGWSNRNPAPIGKLAPEPPPGSMRLAQFLWIVSFLSGAACIFIVYLVRDSQLEWLRETVREMSLDINPESFDHATSVIFWVSTGAVSFVILVEVLIVSLIMTARSWARWMMAAFLLLHLAVAIVAGAFLVPSGATGPYVLGFLAAGFLWALVATVISFIPQSSRWIKSKER